MTEFERPLRLFGQDDDLHVRIGGKRVYVGKSSKKQIAAFLKKKKHRGKKRKAKKGVKRKIKRILSEKVGQVQKRRERAVRNRWGERQVPGQPGHDQQNIQENDQKYMNFAKQHQQSETNKALQQNYDLKRNFQQEFHSHQYARPTHHEMDVEKKQNPDKDKERIAEEHFQNMLTHIEGQLHPQDIAKFKKDTRPAREKIDELQDVIQEYNEAYGDGSHHKSDEGGLSNNQIDEIMKPFRGYMGTFCLDQLDEIYKIYAENKMKKNSGFIINTLPSTTKEVGHWIAVFISTQDCSFEIYDPLALRRKKFYEVMYRMFSRILAEKEICYYLKYKINQVRQQRMNSTNCGWFSMRFLMHRFAGIPFSKATEYEGVENGEEKVEKMKEKFGYI